MDTVKKQTQRQLTDIEKLYFVREFFNTRMTQAAFAHLHSIDRKTFGRWVKKYGNVVQKEISNRFFTLKLSNIYYPIIYTLMPYTKAL